MTPQTRAKLLIAVVAVAAVSAAGVGAVFASSHTSDGVDNETEMISTQSTAHLRVVHASPDAPAVDVSVDNETVLSNVTLGTVSDYMKLSGGSHSVTIAVNETGDVVFGDNVSLENRSVTTLAASGEVSDDIEPTVEPLAFEDDAYTPGSNESAIRIVHLAPEAPPVDVVALPAQPQAETPTGTATPSENATATPANETETPTQVATPTPGEEASAAGNGTVLADGVAFSNASDYLAVPAGDYVVEVREETPENDGTPLFRTNVSLEDGTAYSAMAVGYVIPGEPPADAPFDVTVAADATLDVSLPGAATGDDSGAMTATPTPGENETGTATESAPASPTENTTEAS